MNKMRKEEYLELGKLYAREGKLEIALENLQGALSKYAGQEGSQMRINRQMLDRLPLELLSYYGLCIALVESRVQEGISLCQRAVAEGILRPDFYLNLGKVYLKANQKAKALDTFRSGLEITDKNSELIQEFKKLGIRRKTALHFLPRENFLNRYLGQLLPRPGKTSGSKKKKART